MMRTTSLVLVIVVLSQARPLDYFKFSLTVTDDSSSVHPLYFNLTDRGDFFVRSFDSQWTNLTPATDGLLTKNLIPDVTEEYDQEWHIETNNV